MKKWNVDITFTIQADNKTKAWDLAEEIISKHLRDLANVHSVSELPHPEDWIAINEPIRKMKAGKPEPLILTKRGQALMPDRVDKGYQLEK